MRSLEATRVLAVLGEAQEALRLLSHITPEVLETAEHLIDQLGEDAVNLLIKHRQLVQASKAHLGSDAVMASTNALLRLMKKSHEGSKLMTLSGERSAAIQQTMDFLDRLREQAQQRLNSTVEEDASNQEYYEEVRIREEKAMAEKVQLEQKLKLQRVELARRMHAVQSAEDVARAEIQALQTATATAQGGIAENGTLTRNNDKESYDGERENLMKELTATRARLDTLRAENRAAEMGLRKNKKRAAQDVESVISEYDGDLITKDSEYQASLANYNEVLRQLEELRQSTATMQATRLAAEAEEARIRQEKLNAALLHVRRNRAAHVIQGAWKAFKARKAAEAKKKKKAEGKKKK